MMNYAYTNKKGKVEIDFDFFMELMQERANNDHARWECERELMTANGSHGIIYADVMLDIINRNLRRTDMPLPFEPTKDDLADVDSGYQE